MQVGRGRRLGTTENRGDARQLPMYTADGGGHSSLIVIRRVDSEQWDEAVSFVARLHNGLSIAGADDP